MPDKKQQQPAIRRFTFRADPADDRSLSYSEQLADAERKAGRKVTRVRTRLVRVMGGQGISPSRFNRQVVIGHQIIRTFIFR